MGKVYWGSNPPYLKFVYTCVLRVSTIVARTNKFGLWWVILTSQWIFYGSKAGVIHVYCDDSVVREHKQEQTCCCIRFLKVKRCWYLRRWRCRTVWLLAWWERWDNERLLQCYLLSPLFLSCFSYFLVAVLLTISQIQIHCHWWAHSLHRLL